MRVKQRFFNITSLLFLSFGALLILFPLYITIITAFKTSEESALNFFSLPSSFNFSNFLQVINKSQFFTYVGNSVFITVASVAIISIIVPMVSFAIARNKNGKYFKFLYIYLVAGLFVPFQVLMLPLTKLALKLNLSNQYGLILIYCAFALTQGVFLFVAHFKTIPVELDEAASIDGCKVWQIFFHILMPITKPMMATLIILNSLWIWNDFLLPILLLNRTSDMWTLPLFQYNFKSAYTFDFNLAFASYMFSIIPMLIIYIFLQKYIVSGLTAGAVKS
jgi:raffinose/stachyose/melibiose transport system permease protein